MVLVVVSRVKTVESICVTPSSFSTVHVNVPQVVGYAKPEELAAAESVQLKTPATDFM